MSASTWSRYRDLVYSDLARHRKGAPGPRLLLACCFEEPGMMASLIVRAQQCLFDAGYLRCAQVLRTVGTVALNIDVHPGAQIGRGFLLTNPSGATFGGRLEVGDGVTFEGGVTCAVRVPDATIDQDFAVVGDGAVLETNCVLVGGVRVGRDARIGAGSVVLKDVADGAYVTGVPARRTSSTVRA